MAPNTRRRYDRKFKEAAVKLVVDEGLSAAEVERRLNMGAGIVNRWVKKLYEQDGQERLPEDAQILRKEISKLRKELDQVKWERGTLISCLEALSSRN